MSNYTKTTNFTAKDTLPTGNPAKIVLGADFDLEFNAVSAAISTKADSTQLANVLDTADIGVSVQGYDADTALADVANTWTVAQQGSTQTASVSGSTVLDFATYQNFVLTLTAATTLANVATETVGQSGFIVIKQDATGGRTLSLDTNFKTQNGNTLFLSVTASAIDVIPYLVSATDEILLGQPQLAFA